MAKKVTLTAWINSKLKDKGLTVKEAKKNAGKYKSISAAKKAGSLYYTNKDGKIMIAAFAEDLKKPLKTKFPAIDTSKITKKKLGPHVSEPGDLQGPKLKQRVDSKPPIRLHEGVLKRKRERKAWEKKFGDFYNTNGVLKKKFGGKG
tara:strand:+ start:641 stop:1081 length:441 start_codon:yes stop_codon:yes gene_type:complete